MYYMINTYGIRSAYKHLPCSMCNLSGKQLNPRGFIAASSLQVPTPNRIELDTASQILPIFGTGNIVSRGPLIGPLNPSVDVEDRSRAFVEA